MNYYPSQLRQIVRFIEALDGIEAREEEGEPFIFARPISLTDGDETNWGTLRDEVGGAWSWFPPANGGG